MSLKQLLRLHLELELVDFEFVERRHSLLKTRRFGASRGMFSLAQSSLHVAFARPASHLRASSSLPLWLLFWPHGGWRRRTRRSRERDDQTLDAAIQLVR